MHHAQSQLCHRHLRCNRCARPGHVAIVMRDAGAAGSSRASRPVKAVAMRTPAAAQGKSRAPPTRSAVVRHPMHHICTKGRLTSRSPARPEQLCRRWEPNLQVAESIASRNQCACCTKEAGASQKVQCCEVARSQLGQSLALADNLADRDSERGQVRQTTDHAKTALANLMFVTCASVASALNAGAVTDER